MYICTHTYSYIHIYRYLDSDAAINPEFVNRSLFDALTIWNNTNSSAIYWYVHICNIYIYIYIYMTQILYTYLNT
jgi:hypothetical protein